jgi:hypothetical protein
LSITGYGEISPWPIFDLEDFAKKKHASDRIEGA